MRIVKFCPFAAEGINMKKAGRRLSCTLATGSFQDGGVFWYYNEIITNKVHPKDGVLSKNNNLLAQVENTRLISPIIPPHSHGGGDVLTPLHSWCHFPSIHHTNLLLPTPQLAQGTPALQTPCTLPALLLPLSLTREQCLY